MMLLGFFLFACGGPVEDIGVAEQASRGLSWSVTYQGRIIGRFTDVRGLEDRDRTIYLLDGYLEAWETPRDVDLHHGNLTWHVHGAVHNGKGNSAMTEEIEMVIERLERG